MEDNRDYWKSRRQLVIGTLGFCYLLTLFLMFNGDHDSKLHENIMSGIMSVLMATIAGYIGTSVYDDVNSGMPEDIGKDYWKIRRRVTISNVLFTMVCSLYLTIYGVADSKLHIAIVTNLMLTSGIVIVCYIGGASIQDKYMKKIK